MASTIISPNVLTNDGLVKAFYASYLDESPTFEPADYAREIVSRGDAMWNWPVAVEDAEDELSA